MTGIKDFLDDYDQDPTLVAQLLEMAREALAEHHHRLRDLFSGTALTGGASASPEEGEGGFFSVAKTGAHKLANVITVLRRTDLAVLANELESAARGEDEQACREAWTRFEPEIVKLRDAVDGQIGSDQNPG